MTPDNAELSKQLASAEEHNARLREALGAFAHRFPESQLAQEALSTPASREALDAYVAEKVKGLQCENDLLENKVLARDAELWGRTQKILSLTRQRDLAVEALEFIPRSGSKLGAAAEEKRLTAIAAIKESERQ